MRGSEGGGSEGGCIEGSASEDDSQELRQWLLGKGNIRPMHLEDILRTLHSELVMSLADLMEFAVLPRFDQVLPPLAASRIRHALDGEGPRAERKTMNNACWGACMLHNIRVTHGPCTPNFVMGQPHLQHKFCHNCRQGFAVRETSLRVLAAGQRIPNSSSGGFWNTSAPHDGFGVPFRLINQSKRCSGPTLILFDGDAPGPNDSMAPVPSHFVRDDGTVWLCVAYNTLMPLLKGSKRSIDGRTISSDGTHLLRRQQAQIGSASSEASDRVGWGVCGSEDVTPSLDYVDAHRQYTDLLEEGAGAAATRPRAAIGALGAGDAADATECFTDALGPLISPPTSPPSMPLPQEATAIPVLPARSKLSTINIVTVHFAIVLSILLGILLNNPGTPGFSLSAKFSMSLPYDQSPVVGVVAGQLEATRAEAAPNMPAPDLVVSLASKERESWARVVVFSLGPLPCALLAACFAPVVPSAGALPYIYFIITVQTISRAYLASLKFASHAARGDSVQVTAIRNASTGLWMLLTVLRSLGIAYKRGAYLWHCLRFVSVMTSVSLIATLLLLRWFGVPDTLDGQPDYPPAQNTFEGGLAIATMLTIYALAFTPSVRMFLARAFHRHTGFAHEHGQKQHCLRIPACNM